MEIINQLRKNKTLKEVSDEENARADLAKAQSYLEYLAMMCDVDIPTDDKSEVSGNEE